MFKKFAYSSLVAILVLAGYLNFSNLANALPPVAVDDTITNVADPNVYMTINVTSNDSWDDGSLSVYNIDIDPATPGIQNQLEVPEGYWIVDTFGFSGAEIIFSAYDLASLVGSTITTPYVLVDYNDELIFSNPATISMGFAPVLPEADDDSGSGYEGDAILVDYTNGDNFHGYTSYDKVDLDLNTIGVQQEYVTPLGTFSHATGSPYVSFQSILGLPGVATTTYQMFDSQDTPSNIATITVTINAIVPPEAFDDSIDVLEGGSVDIIFSDNDNWNGFYDVTNVDLDPITVGIQSSTTTALGEFTHTSGNAYIRFQSTLGFIGTTETPYQIFNTFGTPSNTATITVTVNPNQPPVAEDYTYFTTIYTGDTALIDPYYLGNDSEGYNFLPNSDVDLDLNTSGFQQILTSIAGNWIIPDSGYLRFQSALNFVGAAMFPFRLKDQAGLVSNTATITINVINDIPTAGDDSFSTAIDVPITVDLFTNDSPQGGVLDIVDLNPATTETNETSTTTPYGTWVVQSAGTVLYTPNALFEGVDSIQYVAIDSVGARSLPATAQVTVEARPFLRLYNGVVAKSNLSMMFDPANVPSVSGVAGACPRIPTVNSNMLAEESFNSNVKNVQYNDDYTGMIVIENIGSDTAFDVSAYMEFSSYLGNYSNECVMKGDGTVLVSGVDYVGNIGPSNSFAFNTASSSLAAYSPTSGENIIVITYDIHWAFAKDQTHEAQITNYAASLGGININNDYDVRAFTAFLENKGLLISNSAPTPTLSISGLTIGQRIDYQVEIELPETASSSSSSGSSTIIRTTLPNGMVFYDENTGTPETYVSYVASSSIQNLSPSFTFLSDQIVEFSFSDFYNSDTDISTSEKITLTIPAVVLDTPENTASTGVEFINLVELIDRYDNETFSETILGVATSSAKVLQEPALVLRNLSATSTNASGTIQYLFELFQEDGFSDRSDAFGVEFYFQTNGPGLVPLTITNPVVGGLPAATTTIGSLFLAWPTISGAYTSSSPITISFTGTMTPTTSTTTLAYPVGLSFSTLPGNVSGPLSSFSALSHERLYAGTSTQSVLYVFSGVTPTSTPTTTVGCIGSCGGGYNNPGCTDPLAINYNKTATVDNGTCKYPSLIGPTSTPPIVTPTSTLPTVPPVVIPPSGTTTPPITYIPKAKRQLILQLTGPLEALQTRLRRDALKIALSEGNAVTIPHIGVSKPVLQLPNLDPLLNEFWMLPWGSTPEKGNNTILVAHSYNQQKGKQWPNVLFNLDKVKAGEKITFDWKGKTYTYEVVDNKQFDAKDVYIEDDTKESVLTIYGCGKYTTKYRQVVRAVLRSVE